MKIKNLPRGEVLEAEVLVRHEGNGRPGDVIVDGNLAYPAVHEVISCTHKEFRILPVTWLGSFRDLGQISEMIGECMKADN